MKYLLVTITAFTICFSTIAAAAENKVVVIPLRYNESIASATGGIKVYDNNNQFLGYLIGSDDYLKVFNPTLNLVLPFSKVNLSLLFSELPWRFLGTTCYDQGDYYVWATKTTNFPDVEPHKFAGFLLEDRYRVNSYFSYDSPAIHMTTESKKEHNGTALCDTETATGFHFKITTYASEDLPITLPIALPIRYEIAE